MFHMLTRGLIKKESPSAMAFMFFKHPPTEARTLAKPQPASHSFDERQLESGFGGWADEKIKPARAADQLVSNECWHVVRFWQNLSREEILIHNI